MLPRELRKLEEWSTKYDSGKPWGKKLLSRPWAVFHVDNTCRCRVNRAYSTSLTRSTYNHGQESFLRCVCHGNPQSQGWYHPLMGWDRERNLCGLVEKYLERRQKYINNKIVQDTSVFYQDTSILGWTKSWTRAGLEPATSGLTWRHSSKWAI